MTDPLEERLAAVERAVEGDRPASKTSSGSVEERCTALEERVAELEAAVEAVEGYVGHVERTDDALERRANAALAAVDDLEARVTALEGTTDERQPHRSERRTSRLDNRLESRAGRQPLHDEPDPTTSPRSAPSTQRMAADGGRDEHDVTDDATGSRDERDWADETDEQGLVDRLRERL